MSCLAARVAARVLDFCVSAVESSWAVHHRGTKIHKESTKRITVLGLPKSLAQTHHRALHRGH